jgi:hypothetical protein
VTRLAIDQPDVIDAPADPTVGGVTPGALVGIVSSRRVTLMAGQAVGRAIVDDGEITPAGRGVAVLASIAVVSRQGVTAGTVVEARMDEGDLAPVLNVVAVGALTGVEVVRHVVAVTIGT